MSSAQIYQVPVVCNGLREPESIIQLIDSLEKLDRVFNDVYSSISSRVQREKSRIDNVTGRLNNAQHKVNQIIGSKSAITVFSSAKYPTEKSWPDYTPLYGDKPRLPFKPSHYHLHDVVKQPIGGENFLEVNDLVFIEKSIDSASKEISIKEGLGHLPSHIPSVSNLLLFNTQENPYKKYSNTLDNLSGSGSDDTPQVLGEKKKTLQAAPITVEKGDILPQMDGGNVNYQPVINPVDLPSYNFPSALPLRGVAENITWAAETMTGIAPSNQVSASLPIFDNAEGMPSSAPIASQPQSSMAPPPLTSTPPPPPPPVNGAAPPPPPPPPKSSPAPPPPPSQVAADDSDNDGDDQGGDGSAIGNLLADIRRGHKNRLKKIEKEEGDDAPPPPKKSGGGDVMSDLILALGRRRQSIASSKKKESKSTKKQQHSDSDEDSDSDSEEWKD